MKFVRIFLISCAVALAFQSCNKEEEESTKSYLDGTLAISHRMPQYVFAGKKYDFVPSGLSASDSTHIAYYFTHPTTDVKDTIMSKKYPATKYTLEIPDTLASLTLECVGYAEGSTDYYTSSSSVNFVVVDPRLNEGTITGFRYFDNDIKIRLYDDEYYAFRLGGTIWMRQNLAYIVGDESKGWSFGHPYYESDAMRTIFGSYYTWEEAMKACPEGWQLPSDQDWMDLLKNSGVTGDIKALKSTESGAGKLMDWFYFNTEKMWEYYRGVDVTNDSHISAMPVGYAIVTDRGRYEFAGYGEYAAFWTSDEIDGKGVYRYIYQANDAVYAERAVKDGFAAAVRCIKK